MNLPCEEWLAEAPNHVKRTGRPLIGLCFAQSLDGSIAQRRGEPLALSGRQANLITHQLRAVHDAILIGIGTLLSDDPQLTVRLVEGDNPQPVILDSHLRTPPGCRLLQPGAGRRSPWIAAALPVEPHRQTALESKGARVIDLPPEPTGGVSLTALLEHLTKSGICSLMVEGGGGIISSFLAQNLFDWVSITIAPVFVGGFQAVQKPLGSQDGQLAPRLREVLCTPAGSDLIVWGKR